MLVIEIITICSTTSAVIGGIANFYKKLKNNEYSADYARVVKMNQFDRGTFSEIVIPNRHVVAGHTHGDAAAVRSAGSAAAEAYAYACLRSPFYMSMSASDQRAGRKGERRMHWAKDFNAEVRKEKPEPNDMIIMIDVDEHIPDLPQKLHDYFLPVVLFTFQPSVAAGTFVDYKFTFDKDNNVVYTVTGGAGSPYIHKVWDYSPDCLVMRKKFLGITYAKSFFTVEKRQVDENHQLIALTPLVKFGPVGCFFSMFVSGHDFKRLEPVQKDTIRLAVSCAPTKDSPQGKFLMSTAAVGTYNAATVDIKEDNAAASMAAISDSKLSGFQVQGLNDKLDKKAVITLVEYHRKTKGQAAAAVPASVASDAVNNYTINPSYHMDEKPSVTPFMEPILPDCYAPTCSKESDEAMVQERIVKLQKPADALGATELKYAMEFAQLTAKILGPCVPVDYDYITEKLSRPSQARITGEASFVQTISTLVKSFMKKEAYQKIAPGRPIATINGKDKYEYSAYTYAVAALMEKLPWYAFGRKPKGISERVQAICAAATHVINTDLSRFDGRINRSSRQFEELLMKALFPEEHWPSMLRAMRRQYNSKGVTRMGVKYKNLFNRLSGSPETALFNSFLNAFMAYCCLREAGLESDEAWAKLGVYGGDDGLTADVDPELYTRVCAKFGHVLEADKVIRGESGVTFLARLYSRHVWYGSPHSCADISRSLSKLHTCVNLDNSAEDKLYEKAYALYLSDAATPIIGEFVTRAVELSRRDASEFKNIHKVWNANYSEDEQYPNENADGWMDEVVIQQRLDGFRLGDFRLWLAKCRSLKEMLKCPRFIDKPDLKVDDITQPVKVNGELYKPRDASIINPSPASSVPAHASKPPMANPTNNPGTRAVPTRPPMRSTRRRPQPTGDNNGGNVFIKSASAKLNTPVVNGVSNQSSAAESPTHDDGVGLGRSGWATNDTSELDRLRDRLSNQRAPSAGVPPKSRLVGVETNPGPPTRLSEDPILVHAADLVDAGYAFVPQAAVNSVETVMRTNPYGHVKKSYIDPAVSRVVEALDPVIDYFSPKKRLVGVELNPGPTPQPPAKTKVIKEMKQLEKYADKIAHQPQPRDNRRPQFTPLPKAARAVQGGVAASYATGMSTGQPVIIRTRDDSVVIKHRELVSIVAGTVNFTSTTIPIQPGLSGSFPWLSTQTPAWEKYRFRKLRATYYTRTGTSTPGSMMLVPDYDSADAPPTSALSASAFHGTADDAPWKTITLNFDMKRSRELFIRNGPLAVNLDIKTYDFAVMFLCTADGTAVNWGKVYLEYEIELINPQVLAAGAGLGGTITNGGGSVTPTSIFGLIPTIVNGSYIQSCTSAGVITLTNLTIGAEYWVSNSMAGTVITIVNTFLTSGVTLKTSVQNDLINGAGTVANDTMTVTATATTAVITVSAVATTISGASFGFMPVAPGGF